MDGGESGAWIIACDSCSIHASCEWRSARWITGNHECRLQNDVPRNELKECSKNKKVITLLYNRYGKL